MTMQSGSAGVGISDMGKLKHIRQNLDSPLAAKVYAMLFAIAASFMGYEKVEEYRASNAPGDVTVDVVIEAPTGSTHSHGTVLTRTDIKQLIREAIEAQHKEDVRIFKQKEPWENGG